VERTIAELNQAANLTEIGVQTAYEIAGAAISASNQIRGQDNKPQADRVAVAQSKLQELKTFASEDRDTAQFFVREFEFLTEHCSFMLPDAQKQRIESLTKQLKDAIAIHNLSAIQKLAEDAERELNNLPEEIQKLLIAKDAIRKAHSVDPTRASFMADKLHRLIHAMEHEKINEANRLWNELVPDIREYGLREFSAANIATGITR
jgi:molecular chaperone DnaK